MNDAIIRVENYKQHFTINGHLTIKAVDGISFAVKKGEILGLVGESGSGKSTVARGVMGLYHPTDGEIYFKDMLISDRKSYSKHKDEIRRSMQIIFQDSAAALNPRMRIESIIAEPLAIRRETGNKAELQDRIEISLRQVGLDPSCRSKYPGELSGGQRQRVAIARSLIAAPTVIIADEPVASLDVSIQAQIISLFQQIQSERGFSVLFIAHDLSMVRYICDRVCVMFRGKIVEIAPARELFDNPLHPYTRSLLTAIPVPDPEFERAKQIVFYNKQSFDPKAPLKETSPGHFVMM